MVIVEILNNNIYKSIPELLFCLLLFLQIEFKDKNKQYFTLTIVRISLIINLILKTKIMAQYCFYK